MDMGSWAYSGSINDGGVLLHLSRIWLKAIQNGLQEKARIYAKGAKECLDFYLGDHKYLFNRNFQQNQLYLTTTETSGKPVRVPHWQISDNIAAKFVQIMKPYLTQGLLVRAAIATKPFMPPEAAYGIQPGFIEQMLMTPPEIMQQLKQNPLIAQQYQAVQIMNRDKNQVESESQLRSARAEMRTKVLNYAVQELNLMAERQRIVEESLVIGAGVWLTELISMPGTQQKLPGSRYIQMTDVVWDPDATQQKDCKWVAIQCRHPAWLVARLYGIPESQLRPNACSTVTNRFYEDLLVKAGPQNSPKTASADEVIYWKVWSRMGSGARLRPLGDRPDDVQLLDDQMGDFCFFVVTEAADYPLNMNEGVFQKAMQAEQLAQQSMMMGVKPQVTGKDILRTSVSWGTEYYLDVDDPWPITTLEYHKRSGSPYPIPHLEFCLSYMKFLVWILSFVADKTYRSNRDFWLIDDTLSEQLIEAIENGEDEVILKVKDLDGKTVEQVIKLLAAPEVHKSILDIYQFFEQKFSQMSGLTELLQAELSRSMRTATEAQVISDVSQLRPRSMAQEVAATDSRVARKEAIAWQKHGQPQDLAPILGMPGANAWIRLNQGIDPVSMLRETQYDVVASPGRTLDIETRMDQANKMSQTILPMLMQYGMAYGKFKSANQVLSEIAKANQIDPDLMQLPDVPMMPPEAPKGVASPPKPAGEQKGP